MTSVDWLKAIVVGLLAIPAVYAFILMFLLFAPEVQR